MKFPDDFGRRLTFMNLKKKCKRIHYQIEQAFRERNLHKIGLLSKKDPKLFRKSVKSLLRDTLQKKGTSIHPNSWKPYFKALLNNIRCSSKTSANAKEQLTQLEEDVQGKQNQWILFFPKLFDSFKVLKLNKSKFEVISNEMLRCNPKAISKVLCKLFNYILKNKTFPEMWNISLIKPLHKNGNTTKHDNYRGICISNHLSKLFT